MESDRLVADPGGDAGMPGDGPAPPLGGYGKPLDECGASAGGSGGGGVSNEPFYLLREPVASELTGSSHLLSHYNLDAAFAKFFGKKVEEKLSNFLPGLPGMIDAPAVQDGTSLRAVMENPPPGGKELQSLPSALMAGFQLCAGPLPDQYRLLHQMPLRKKQTQKHSRPDTMSDDGKGGQQQEHTTTHKQQHSNNNTTKLGSGGAAVNPEFDSRFTATNTSDDFLNRSGNLPEVDSASNE